MTFILPAAASFLQAISFTLDKVALSVKKMTYKTYNGISFPLIFLFTLVIFFVLKPESNAAMFETKYLLLIAASVILGMATNLIFYRALKSDLLSEMEIITLLGGIPLILFASIFFKDERNYFVLVLALVAVLATVWSHWEKHHFKIAKKTLPFLLWTLAISPFRGIMSKTILEAWNPITLQLVRDGIIACVFIVIFFKDVKKVPPRALPILIMTNIFTSIAWILYYFSYQVSGIVYTVLIFSIQPLLVYFSSVFVLKEKLQWKKVVAFAVILVAIGIEQIWG